MSSEFPDAILERVLDSSKCDRCLGRVLSIGIGAQRSGTTWLSRYMDKHPEILTTSIKELHVFDSVMLRPEGQLEEKFANALLSRKPVSSNSAALNHYSTLADRVAMPRIQGGYFQFFEKRIEEGHKAFGEITPEYALLSPETYSRIYASHPNTRFFFILRDPVERYLSALAYWSRLRPRFDVKENMVRCLDRDLFTKYSLYQDTISRLLQQVPRENVLILFMEELFDSPDTILAQLCDFLGVSHYSAQQVGLSTEEQINSSKKAKTSAPSSLESRQIRERFNDVYLQLPALIGRPLPAQWSLEL